MRKVELTIREFELQRRSRTVKVRIYVTDDTSAYDAEQFALELYREGEAPSSHMTNWGEWEEVEDNSICEIYHGED